MRSREPWRLPAGQSRAVPFLQAAVLFAALCIFARSAALVLAAFLAAPVPAAQTLLHLGQQAVESRAAAASAESVPEAASAPSPAQETAAPVQTGVEQYFVALQPDEARPADAGTVTEQQFGQGSGEKYIPCGAGSINGNLFAAVAGKIELQGGIPRFPFLRHYRHAKGYLLRLQICRCNFHTALPKGIIRLPQCSLNAVRDVANAALHA